MSYLGLKPRTWLQRDLAHEIESVDPSGGQFVQGRHGITGDLPDSPVCSAWRKIPSVCVSGETGSSCMGAGGEGRVDTRGHACGELPVVCCVDLKEHLHEALAGQFSPSSS